MNPNQYNPSGFPAHGHDGNQQNSMFPPSGGPAYPDLHSQGQHAHHNVNMRQAPPQQAYGGGPGPGGAPLFQDLASGQQQFFNQVSESPLAAIGLQYGGQMFAGGKDYVDSKLGQVLSRGVLKYYFNVNNSYVLNKIKILLCPFLNRSWKRRMVRTQHGDQFLPPRDDINAPDLYIPTMAFVTYVLAVAFVYGTALKFTPELIGMTASTAFVLLTLEVLFIKAGFYITDAASVPIVDVVSYCGYKYVSLVICILAGFLFGTSAYYLCLLVLGLFMTVFMVRTMRVVLLSDPATQQVVDPQSHGESAMRRNYLVLLVGVLQPVLLYFLGVTV
eukprot:TRINITY_DN4017_c0_g1_i1.p1 TRINITY_DN4017_c0_g1~~TRINITY_DN4017_c0_g1_i1.p1  ORF type:complete len:331 (+),score=50.16 TRINITY_DN4017_c0_g1_i1:49-1041(+)